jgi:hypothetical protein
MSERVSTAELHSILTRCALAVKVLKTLCWHAGLRSGFEVASELLADIERTLREEQAGGVHS